MPESYLSALKLTPNLAQASLALEAQVEAVDYGQHLLLEAKVWHQGNFIASTTVAVTGKHVKAQLSVANVGEHEWSVHTWTPNNPQLYDLELHLKENGQEGDEVWSYFGMREIRHRGPERAAQRQPSVSAADPGPGLLAGQPFDPAQRSGADRGH